MEVLVADRGSGRDEFGSHIPEEGDGGPVIMEPGQYQHDEYGVPHVIIVRFENFFDFIDLRATASATAPSGKPRKGQ